MAQVVECLPIKYEALTSNTSITHTHTHTHKQGLYVPHDNHSLFRFPIVSVNYYLFCLLSLTF
jgi:hypothetical protein